MFGSPTRLLSQRNAKMICTLGPATDSDEAVDALLHAGMNGARLNFAFGPLDAHVQRIQRVRARSEAAGQSVAVIADLPGRKIRIGQLDAPILLKNGDSLCFVADTGQVGDLSAVPVSDRFFHPNMAVGDVVLMSSGSIELEVAEYDSNHAVCRVVFGGQIRSRDSVHVPGMTITGNVLTEADEASLAIAVKHRVDYLALSHVTEPADLLAVQERLAELGAKIPIIAKIERSEAFARLDGILARADAIMIRRGDLSAQIEMSQVPLVQKRILFKANRAGVPVIIATQMLGSMVSSPIPTRAEASDVSNAVKDGADGLMLSSETAIGDYPRESAEMMTRIIAQTEVEQEQSPLKATVDPEERFEDVSAYMGCLAAAEAEARYIICVSESGFTAKLVAKYRPRVPVLVFCPRPEVQRRVAIYWGATSKLMKAPEATELLIDKIEARLIEEKLVVPGDRLVVIYGSPVHMAGNTNAVRLHQVGSP